MYLIDTNVISEIRKIQSSKATPKVTSWFRSVASQDLYVSVISLHELEVGILLAERRDTIQAAIFRNWLKNQVLPFFTGRILPVDTAIALRSAVLHVPNPHPLHDGLIAATALVHNMTVVTRNMADFASTGVAVLNPWE